MAQAQNYYQNTPPWMQQYNAAQSAMYDPQLQDMFDQYSRGGASSGSVAGYANDPRFTQYQLSPELDSSQIDQIVNDAPKALQGKLRDQLMASAAAKSPTTDISGLVRSGIASNLATDPRTAYQFASDQLSSDPVLSKYFGDNGWQSQLMSQEKDLAANGGKLTNLDRDALGQTYGDVARTYGGQENALTNELAARGLASAPSGAAGAEFSGMAGNKYEQLAKAQTQIADQRMQRQMQQLQSLRGTIMGLGSLGEGALQNRVNSNRGLVSDQTGREYQNTYGNQMDWLKNQQGQANEQFTQNEATRNPTLGEYAMGLGGMAAGGLAGGFGTGAGMGLANSMYPKQDYSNQMIKG